MRNKSLEERKETIKLIETLVEIIGRFAVILLICILCFGNSYEYYDSEASVGILFVVTIIWIIKPMAENYKKKEEAEK